MRTEPWPLRLPVLVDEDVWDEFALVIQALDGRWTSGAGRAYVLDLAGRRLRIDLVIEAFTAQPSGDEIDADLFELAGQLLDTVPGEWSSAGLRRVAEFWGWTPPGS